MQKYTKTELFASVPVPRALAAMAIPTIISQLINLIYNMVDAFFIGRTGNSYMMAATTVTLTLTMLNVAFANLFGVGGGSLIARLMGRKQEDEAKRVSAYSVRGAVLLGLILITAALVLAKSFFPFFFALVVILEFFAFVYTVKEYEYSFMNGDVDVDMIQGKRRRKTVCTFSCREAVLMAPCGGHEGDLSGQFTSRLDASVSPKSPDRWFIILEREDGNRELLLLSPNERLLAAFKGALGRKMEYTLPKEHMDTPD